MQHGCNMHYMVELSPGQRCAILGQAGQEYDWGKIVEAMLVQLDQGEDARRSDWKWGLQMRSQRQQPTEQKR